MNSDLPKIIIVCGPTGSGKTSLAVLLCKKFDGEIINADSRQVYREMDIGTAKGNIVIKQENKKIRKQEIQGIPIWLIDIAEPNERYNVGQFKIDAEKAIEDIILRGKVPFVVGGTGLYIDALVQNFDLPSVGADPCVCPKPGEHGGSPLQDLVKRLEKLDPEAIEIVDLKNKRRVERALEYCLATGKKFSESRGKGERQYEVLKLSPAVSLQREKLYEKINQRVGEMIDEGLEKEVKMLVKKYGWGSEAMTGIGYREWREGKDLDEIKDKIKQNTRNYAKRQITWFKRDKEIKYVDLKEAEKLVKRFLGKK